MLQVWRYLTYMFIHAGIYHFAFNILVQLILGIPLEMVHGKKEIGRCMNHVCVYILL